MQQDKVSAGSACGPHIAETLYTSNPQMNLVRNLVRFFVWCGLLFATAGCGLDLAGLGTVDVGDAATTDSSADDGISPDGLGPFADAASGDAPPATDASPSDGGGGDAVAVAIDAPAEGGGSCRSMIPSGWSLVAYDLAGNACPPNFAAHAVFGAPVVGADACPCTCGVTQAGSCTQGMLSTLAGRGNANSGCPQAWVSVAISGSACTPVQALSGMAPTRVQASALPGQGGTCSDAVQPDATKVSTPPARFCDVSAAKADAVCDGTVPSGFAACIATSGTAPCPSGTPFMQRYIVEDVVTPQCSACSACSVATACANPVLTAYTDPSCGGSGGSGVPLTVDGTCATVGGQGSLGNVAAVTYTATESSTCIPGSSTAAAQLMNPQTICCR
jgi:hypothetical protein